MADSVYYQLSRYSQPALIVSGTIGAVLNLILFRCRKQLRVASCSLYFQALSANDLLVLYIIVFTAWLRDQFAVDLTKQYNWYCKTSTYLNYTLFAISPYLVVLACVDRLCTSSTSVRLRRVATIRVASFLIPCSVIIIFIVYIHVPINYQLFSTPSNSVCSGVNYAYNILLAQFLLVFYGLIPPLLMVIVCGQTYILLRRQRRRVMPVNQIRARQRDNQLLKMLFIYVTSRVVFTLPFSITFLVAVYRQQNSPPYLITLLAITILLVNVNYATSFYAYTLSTPFYRDELYKLIKHIRERMRRTAHNANFPLAARVSSNAQI